MIRDAIMAMGNGQRGLVGFEPLHRDAEQHLVPVEQLADIGGIETGHMEADPCRGLDQPLARKATETVAHRGDADAQLHRQLGRLEAKARRPGTGNQPPAQRIIGGLEHMGRAHAFSPALSKYAASSAS